MLEWNLLTTLIDLGLDSADYVIIGTGALISYGLPRQISDLDVLVRGAAWDKIRAHPDAEFVRGAVSGDDVVKLHGGLLEFSATWFSGSTTAEIIARADLIPFDDWGTSQNLRFASLADILEYKTVLGRVKDLDDLSTLPLDPQFTARPLPLSLSRRVSAPLRRPAGAAPGARSGTSARPGPRTP